MLDISQVPFQIFTVSTVGYISNSLNVICDFCCIIMPKFGPETLDQRVSKECYSLPRVIVDKELEISLTQLLGFLSHELDTLGRQFVFVSQ